MSEPRLSVTPAQRRAAIEALGLDPDLTTNVSIATDWVSATVADMSGGHPLVVDGQLATVALNGPVTEPELTLED